MQYKEMICSYFQIDIFFIDGDIFVRGVLSHHFNRTHARRRRKARHSVPIDHAFIGFVGDF